MFVFDRSALAVLVPLALLAGVSLYSNQSHEVHASERQQAEQLQERANDQTLAANLPSR
jgi:hypothetical protein